MNEGRAVIPPILQIATKGIILSIRKEIKKMKRRKMTIDEIREESWYFAETQDTEAGICALVDVEDMGYCKDGVTRWYYFNDADGNPAVYYKY